MIEFVFRSIQRLMILFLLNFFAGCGVKSSPTHPKESLFQKFYPSDTEKPGKQKYPEARSRPELSGKSFNSFFQYPNKPQRFNRNN